MARAGAQHDQNFLVTRQVRMMDFTRKSMQGNAYANPAGLVEKCLQAACFIVYREIVHTLPPKT